MLFRWRDAVASMSGPSATTRHVLLTLALHADADGGSCFPSTRLLEQRTGLSRRTVEGRLRDAERDGWISREPCGEGQAWRHMSYTLTFPMNVEQELPQLGGEGASPRPPKVEQELPHLGHEGGESDARRGEPDDVNVGKELPLSTSVNSSKNSSTCDESHESEREARNFPSLGKLPRTGRTRIYPPEFEGAFAALPDRHVAHSKADAYQAWRARTDEVEEIFQLEAAAVAYADDCRDQDHAGTKFVMLASTFFGPGERWRPYSGIRPQPAVDSRSVPFGAGAARMVL